MRRWIDPASVLQRPIKHALRCHGNHSQPYNHALLLVRLIDMDPSRSECSRNSA